MSSEALAPIVIVGGGAAGFACAEAFRKAGGTDPLIIMSADDRAPYFRPDLSKELLAGDKPAADRLADDDWFADNDVDLRLHSRASRLDAEAHTISAGTGADKRTVQWSRCVLATGSSAARLPVPGGDDARLLTIRSAADVERIIAQVDGTGPVAVVGSGFIGCEAASSLRARGIDVTMVSLEIQPQQDRLSEFVGAMIAGWLADAGIDFRGSRSVEGIEFTDDGAAVLLANGERVEAAHILVASGALTNTELAASAGLRVTNGGIHVDSSMRSTADGVFVVGDLAFADNVAAGRPLRVEHWDDAQSMGVIAGKVMAGEGAEWDGLPGFWSTITGETLQYVAWGDGWDEVTARRSDSGISVWYGKNGTIVGLLTHRHDDDQERGKKLILSGAPFPPKQP